MRYYPIYLDLRGRLSVVFGGGEVAEQKIHELLEAGARVRVVAPRLRPELARLADAGEIEHLPRAYRRGDLRDAFLAFSERLGTEVVTAIYREADERGVPVNVQDDTERCSFIAASVLRQGDLVITVSTSGKAPALAVRLRQELEGRLGKHYARFLDLAGRVRQPLAEQKPDFETRRELWYRLVDSDVLELLRRGEDREARRRIVEVMGVPAEVLSGAPQP